MSPLGFTSAFCIINHFLLHKPTNLDFVTTCTNLKQYLGTFLLGKCHISILGGGGGVSPQSSSIFIWSCGQDCLERQHQHFPHSLTKRVHLCTSVHPSKLNPSGVLVRPSQAYWQLQLIRVVGSAAWASQAQNHSMDGSCGQTATVALLWLGTSCHHLSTVSVWSVLATGPILGKARCSPWMAHYCCH